MKKLLTVLTIVLLCMLLTNALADQTAAGFWVDDRHATLAELREDGTLRLYTPSNGRVYTYVWQQSGEYVDYGVDLADGLKGAMECGGDVLVDVVARKTYTRIDEAEFADAIAELTATVKIDVTMEDFIGSWEYAGVHLTDTDETYTADEYYGEVHFIITDGAFSMPERFYLGGVGHEPVDGECEVVGNALYLHVDEFTNWTATLRTDGMMSLKLDSQFPLHAFIYLAKAQ